MTLPKPCTVPDCPAPITHWHGEDGDLYACISALNGRPCPHDDQDSPCYAPRVPAPTSPLHLPDVDAVARAVHDVPWPTIDWDAERDDVKDECRAAARAVLDMIADRQPVWKRVEPGTLIKAGTRWREEEPNGAAGEYVSGIDWTIGADLKSAIFIDTGTIPAPTLTERIRAACNDSPESTISLDVADVEALLDMVGGEGK